jgi:hypothetical protein
LSTPLLSGGVRRRELAPFITSFDTDNFFMYELGGDTSINIWTGIFSPFGNDLWAAICGLVIFHGLAVSILTNKKHRKREKDDKHRSASLVHRVVTVHGYEVSRDIYDSALGFVSGGVIGVESDDGIGRKLLGIGYGFFILVVLAACESAPSLPRCVLGSACFAIVRKASKSICARRHGQLGGVPHHQELGSGAPRH